MKKIYKALIWTYVVVVATFPLCFGLTSPDHFAWVFYLDMSLLFIIPIVTLGIWASKMVDIFID